MTQLYSGLRMLSNEVDTTRLNFAAMQQSAVEYGSSLITAG